MIAHTVTPDRRVRVRFGGKVVQVDTGMQSAYIADGHASALDIRDGVFTAVYLDRTDIVIPAPAGTTVDGKASP